MNLKKNDYHIHYKFANNQSFDFCACYFTVFILNIQTPKLFTILYLKFQRVQFTYPMLCLKIAGWVANSVDPDETLHLLIWVYTVCSRLPNAYSKVYNIW